MSTILEIRDLSRHYGAIRALDAVSLSVAQGSVLALLGPNGAGKSTLFGCVLGFTRPDSGEIRIHGQPLTEDDRARFSYVAERVALYSARSVLENAVFLAELKGHSQTEVKVQLARVGLSRIADRQVRQLSKGMLQRLGLAIALCGQPELLILDEPFNGLDPASVDVLQSILREEHKRGATLLISTHTISAVEPLATAAAILLRGKLAAAGPVENVGGPESIGESLETIYHRIARTRPELQEVFA